MAKKKYIQVAGNPKYSQPINKNKQLINPDTGTSEFGRFPEIPEYQFPAGPIYLRYGIHNGPNSGFGFKHIWDEHFSHIQNSEDVQSEIVSLITSITKNGHIYYEQGQRNIVFQLHKGILILELREDGNGNSFYSIITCYTQGHPHGTLIGKLSNT